MNFCFLFQTEDTSFKLFSHKAGEAILYIPSSGSGQDLPLYQQILIQHSYRVTIAEERKLNRHENLNPGENYQLFPNCNMISFLILNDYILQN